MPAPCSARSASPNKRSSTTHSPWWRAVRATRWRWWADEGRAWARAGGVESDEEVEPPDQVLTRPPEFVADIEVRRGHRLARRTAVHADRERARRGRGSLPRQAAPRDRRAVGSASTRSHAPTRSPPFRPHSAADEIARPGPANRPLASPYNLWHSSQWTVDQASALLVCSAARAAAVGVPLDRWLFPHVALHCSSAVTLTARRHLHAWPAMGVLGHAAADAPRPAPAARSRWPSSTPASRWPCGCSNASSTWITAATPTLTGGMAFAGGPFNHYVLLSTVTMGHRPAPSRASSAWSRRCRA